MLLIALVAVAGFTVLAQRRRRSLGMLESVGATDAHVGLVVRANGLVVGVVGCGGRHGDRPGPVAGLPAAARTECAPSDRGPGRAVGGGRRSGRARARRDLRRRVAACARSREGSRSSPPSPGGPRHPGRPVARRCPGWPAGDRAAPARLRGQHRSGHRQRGNTGARARARRPHPGGDLLRAAAACRCSAVPLAGPRWRSGWRFATWPVSVPGRVRCSRPSVSG